MNIQTKRQHIAIHNASGQILRELGFAAHRLGYRQARICLCAYCDDPTQSFTKEIYPYAAKLTGCNDGRSAEHCIRLAIADAWVRSNRSAWDPYFPYAKKPPTNKQFIATLADHLRQITPPDDGGRG